MEKNRFHVFASSILLCLLLSNLSHVEASMNLQIESHGKYGSLYSLHSKFNADSSQWNLAESKILGNALALYTVDLLVGTPPQKVRVALDTGSANLGIVGRPELKTSRYYDYLNSSTSEDLKQGVTVNYGSGTWSGIFTKDLISFSDTSAVSNISALFARVTIQNSQFFVSGQFDGIWGMAYKNLAVPKYNTPDTFLSYINAATNFTNIFGMLLCPVVPDSGLSPTGGGGVLTLNGYDPTKIIGGDSAVLYTETVHQQWFAVALNSIQVGSQFICAGIAHGSHTIVDSGTSAIVLPMIIYLQVIQSIYFHVKNNSNIDLGPDWASGQGSNIVSISNHTGLTNPSDFLNLFPTIYLHFPLMSNSSQVFQLAIQPQFYLEFYQPDSFFVLLQGNPRPSLGLVLGGPVVQAYYIVYDMLNNRVGFGPAQGCSLSTAKSYHPALTPYQILQFPASSIPHQNMPFCSSSSSLLRTHFLSLFPLIFFISLLTVLSFFFT